MGEPLSVGPAKVRVLLATLLLRANHVVSVADIAERMWGQAPPANLRRGVQLYVVRLRQTLGCGSDVIVTEPGGYRIRVEPDQLDQIRFEELIREADRMSAKGDLAAESTLLGEALALWRGPVLSDVDSDTIQLLDVPAMAERHLVIEERWVEVELRRGRHSELVSRLRVLTTTHPFRETFWAHLMLALHRAGRPAEALLAYKEIRTALVDELGLEPGPQLHRLRQRILAADPELTSPPPPADARVRSQPGLIPRQLPVDVHYFIGRERILADLHTLLDRGGDGGSPTVMITAIDGTAGVGKTALAVHFAHQVAERFPDGQLYVDLRGYAATPPATAAEALGWMLRSFGVPAERIPAGEEEQAALYRSVLAGKRVLVILDNARGATQVLPLLPGSSDCLVVVTSRTTLATLDGATHLHLDILSEREALALLARLAGAGRVDAEPVAAADLVASCARLPLAVRIAGARLAARPTWTVAALVERLADETRRLDELRVGERAVRASFAVTFRALKASEDPVDQNAARLFRLLGVLDWVQMSVPVAAALLDEPQADAAAALEHLLDAHLLDSTRSGRYHTHDLLHLYARDEARHHEPEAVRRAALHRALDCYLAAAEQATLLINPGAAGHVGAEPTRSPHGGFALSRLADLPGWTDAEHANLVAAAQQAAAGSGDTARRAVRLVAAIQRPFNTRAYWRDMTMLGELATEVARGLGDRAGEALSCTNLAWANLYIGGPDKVTTLADYAVAIWRELGDPRGEALCLIYLGYAAAEQGRMDDAITCHEDALAIYSDLGDGEGEARALNALGLDHNRLDRLDEAIAYHQRSLAIYRTLGDRSGVAAALGNLGWAHHRAGQHKVAIAYHQYALTPVREIGHRYHEAEFLWALGKTHHALGHHDEARAYLHHSITILSDIGALTSDAADTLRRQPVPHTPKFIQRNT